MQDRLSRGPKLTGDLSRVGSGLARGTSRKKWLTAAAWSGTWPAPGASLDLDFVNDRGWVRGSGQGRVMDAITYTRAGDANFVNSQGLIQRSSLTLDPTTYVASQGTSINPNLFTWSEDFTNAAWTKTGLTVSSSVEQAPTGISSTFRLTEASGSITLSELYNRQYGTDQYNVLSVYAKEDPTSAKRYLVLGLYYTGLTRWAYAVIDVATKDYVIRSDGIQNIAVGMAFTDMGNGWTRFSTAIQTPLASQRVVIGITNTFTPTNSYNLGGYTGDGVSGMFITGAQLEISNGAAESVRPKPRFDWSNTIQLMPQNELTLSRPDNIITWQSATSDFGTTTGINWNSSTGLNGTLSGATFVDTNSFLSRTLGSLSANKRISLHCKAISGSNITISFRNPSAGSSTLVFNPNNLTFTQTAGSIASNLLYESSDNSFARLSFVNSFAGANIQIRVAGGTNDVIDAFQINDPQLNNTYVEAGLSSVFTLPLSATSTVNGMLIEEARINYVLWCRDLTKSYTPTNKNWFQNSNVFTDAVWSFDTNQAQITRTAGFGDPFSGSAATRIQPNSGRTAANAYFGQRTRTLYPSTYSIYMKAAEYQYGVISLFTYVAGNFAVFNLSAGTILTAPTVSGLSAAIESVGNGWYRCSLTVTLPSLSRGFLVSTSPDGTITTTANGTSGILIYGAQAENTVSPSSYENITSLPSALWTHNNVSVVRNQTGVDGISTSACLVSATANNAQVSQLTLLSPRSSSASMYLKRVSGSGVIQITLDGVTWSTVDLSSTDWRRVALNGAVTNPAVGIKIATNGNSVAVDYAQIEDLSGATPYGASSPIFTTSATVTRPADFPVIFNRSANAQIIDLTKFTVYAEIDITFRNGYAAGGIVSVGTNANDVFWSPINLDGRTGVGFLNPQASSLVIPVFGTTYKVALTHSQGIGSSRDQNGAINGIKYSTSILFDSATSRGILSTPVDRIGIGHLARNPSSMDHFNGRIKRLIIWPNFLNAQVMEELTK